MSSPDTSKTSRPMPPFPKDYHRAVSEMETNNLLRSTLTYDCRTQKGDQKTCLLCGLSYFWRPSRCRTHLGLAGSMKMVHLYKPYPVDCDRFSEVVRELKERDTQTEQASREVTKRSLESGSAGDVIIVDNFCKKARVSNDRPFKIVRTRDEVDMQWARPHDSRVWRELHQDQTWWCQGNHDAAPHVFHYQTHPETRQVH